MSNLDLLWRIALGQYGYVTLAQALEAGVSSESLGMLVHRGQIHHAAYGVYRLAVSPDSGNNRRMLALLWTGASEAALSHESALKLYHLIDNEPIKMDVLGGAIITHVTVSKKCRIRRKGGEHYHIHHQDLSRENIEIHGQMRVVSPATAIEQCAIAGYQYSEIKRLASRALRLGLINPTIADRLTRLSTRVNVKRELDYMHLRYRKCRH